MTKRILGVVALLAVVTAVVWVKSPAFRVKVSQTWDAETGWTAEAREADSVGYVEHAEKQLAEDLQTMTEARRNLAAEAGELAKTIREHSALGEQARAMAEEFRSAYQQASFPVEVCGGAYTEAELRSQVSQLLAEAEGYEQSAANLQMVRIEAESKMEELAVRINATESQIAALATKRELLRVRELTSEGETLLASVDELMTGNRQVIEGTPVRTTQELLAATEEPASRSSDERIDAFLAQVEETVQAVEVEPVAEEETEVIPASFETETSVETKAEQKPAEEEKPRRQKPIYQQS
jgi:hypothetical protein